MLSESLGKPLFKNMDWPPIAESSSTAMSSFMSDRSIRTCRLVPPSPLAMNFKLEGRACESVSPESEDCHLNRRTPFDAGRRFATTQPVALALGLRLIEIAACKVARCAEVRFFWRPYRTQISQLQTPRVETLGFDLCDFLPHSTISRVQ